MRSDVAKKNDKGVLTTARRIVRDTRCVKTPGVFWWKNFEIKHYSANIWRCR